MALRARRGSAYRCKRRFGLAFGHAITLLRVLQLPSRGGWCRRRRGARTHLTSFSFRAFRFATRCPGGRGGLYRRADEGIRPYGRTMAFRVLVGADALIGPLQKPHQPPGQRQRKSAQDVSQTSPGWRFPQGQGVSVPDCRKGPPAIPRRRQEVCAWRRPTRRTFFLFHRARRIFFLMSQKENGGRICPAISMAVIPASNGTHPLEVSMDQTS